MRRLGRYLVGKPRVVMEFPYQTWDGGGGRILRHGFCRVSKDQEVYIRRNREKWEAYGEGVVDDAGDYSALIGRGRVLRGGEGHSHRVGIRRDDGRAGV